MEKREMGAKEYAALLLQVMELMGQWKNGIAALGAGLGALDGRAIERAPLPDTRPLLYELEQVKPPATCASQHSAVLLFLRAARDLRSIKGDLADAARTLGNGIAQMKHCGAAMQQIVAAQNKA